MMDPDIGVDSPSPIKRLYDWIVQWLNEESPPSDVPLCDYPRLRNEVSPGDVILVEGRSRVSRVIKSLTVSPWSHAALYIGRPHDIKDKKIRDHILTYYPAHPSEQLIIESLLGFGTIVQPLNFYERDHIRICRPRGLSYEDAQKLIHYASTRLGLDYDVRQILDLMRFLMPWMLVPRRWQSSLFQHHVGSQTRTVCSTMIAEAFGYVQFPILPLIKRHKKGGVQLFRQNPKLCTPRDFDYSPYFDIIKYPFVDYTSQSNYRLLPWKDAKALTTEERMLYSTGTEPPSLENLAESTDNTSTQRTDQNTISRPATTDQTYVENKSSADDRTDHQN